jgi:hypothetical protein
MIKTLTLLLFSLSWMNLFSQLAVEFKNSSFEGKPDPGKIYIESWKDCGSIEFRFVSPPDLQPGFFEVEMPPVDGLTYLGMVTRDDGTHESVCQKLKLKVLKDSLYHFSIYLAKSDKYISPYRKLIIKNMVLKDIEYVDVNYDQNVVLRIWGGNSECSKEELLYESFQVDHTSWKEYDVQFSPTKEDYKFISLEAYYPDEAKFTRGNLLLDFIHE